MLRSTCVGDSGRSRGGSLGQLRLQNGCGAPLKKMRPFLVPIEGETKEKILSLN